MTTRLPMGERDMFRYTLAAAIHTFRVIKFGSQKALSEAGAGRPNQISLWERGKKKTLRADSLSRLAEAFEITPEQLLWLARVIEAAVTVIEESPRGGFPGEMALLLEPVVDPMTERLRFHVIEGGADLAERDWDRFVGLLRLLLPWLDEELGRPRGDRPR